MRPQENRMPKEPARLWAMWLLTLILLARQVTASEAGLVIQAVASPPELILPQDNSASIRIEVKTTKGAPASHVELTILTRHGHISPVREIGTGRYEATYRPPEQHFPQLEILVIQAREHGLAWLTIPLNGTGKLQVETDQPNKPVTLVVSGRRFGPVQTDQDGRASLSFEAPPGVMQGSLIAADKSVKRIELGVPCPKPILLFSRSKELIADGNSTTAVELFVLDEKNEPWAQVPLKLSANAGSLSEPIMKAPGWYEARFRSPPKVGEGLSILQAWVAGRGDTYRAQLHIQLKPGPPARLALKLKPKIVESGHTNRVLVVARLSDANGNIIRDTELVLTSSAGKLTVVQPQADGSFVSWLETRSIPTARTEVMIRATAFTPGASAIKTKQRLHLAKPRVSRVPREDSTEHGYIIKGLLMTTAVAAILPGTVLMALDGQETCDAATPVSCPEVYDTMLAGSILVGCGSALVLTTLVIHLLDDDETEQPPPKPALQVVPVESGMLLKGIWSF